MKKYYYADTQKVARGPFDRTDLDEMLRKEQINLRTLVIQEGGSTWTSYEEMFNEVKSRQVSDEDGTKPSTDSFSRGVANFAVGFLRGVLRQFLYPAIIVIKACMEIEAWGRNKGVPVDYRRIVLSNQARCVFPMTIFLIALIALLDVPAILIFEKSVLAMLFVPEFVASQIDQQIRLSDFQSKIAMVVAELLITYSVVVPLTSLVGELIDVLASIGFRKDGNNIPSERK